MKCFRPLLCSCFLALAVNRVGAGVLVGRQVSIPPIGGDSTTGGNENTATTAGTTTKEEETTTQQTTTSPTTTSPTTTTQNTNTNTNNNTPTPTTNENSATQTNTNANSNTNTPATSNGSRPPSTGTTQQTQQPFTSQSISIGPSGEETVVIVTITPSDTATGSSAASSASESSESSNSNSDDDGSSLGTGSIIGLSVAGGVALLGIVAFFIWKFTRKRNSDYDHDEAIKWPELNAHNGDGTDSHPLPVNSTGRAGFDTGSEVSLSRTPSIGTNNYSTSDVHDPYAVPPLPHMNPNQPYRDDPTATAAGYYDPYRGPVPNTIHDEWTHGGEAIPMTQMAAPGGRASPAPGLNPYERAASPMVRTTSPGPQMAYGASPQMGYAAPAYGRSSPGPQAAYGMR